MPSRRASIAASITARAAGGALRYRASSSGAPARNWTTCPSAADSPASTSRTSPARASPATCAGVNDAGTVMSWPASSSRACACRSPALSGRAVSVSQNRGHSVASTSTGARAGSRSSSRSPAATRSPSPGSAGPR